MIKPPKIRRYRDPKKIQMAELTMIVAMANRRVIGNKGASGLLWRLSEDMQHFKRYTLGNICIFGRATFQNILEGLGKPLPGRISIVLTRDKEYKVDFDGVFVAHSAKEALTKARRIQKAGQQIFICGGEDIYKLFLPFTDRIIATHINKDVYGTAIFPELGKEWKKDQSEKNISTTGIGYEFVTYKKRP